MMIPNPNVLAADAAAENSALTTAIIGLGTAVPSLRVTQSEVLAFVLENFGLSEPAKALYRRAMGGSAIQTRHFALDALSDCLDGDPDRIAARFERSAADLGALALSRALAGAGLSPRHLDYIAAATCTGYLCPGLSAHILERAHLRHDARMADIVGMGCGAALPALEQARNFVVANPGATAAVVCAELCSAALFSNEEPGIIVSNAIFADGAAAVILRKSGGAGASPALARLRAFASETRPAWRDTLRFRIEDGRLKNVLDRTVPAHAGEALAAVSQRLLDGAGWTKDDVDRWILHAGGSKVLDAAEAWLKIPPEATAAARSVLRGHGNMSSPTVLFVLAETLKERPAPGERGLLASFGAGFSAHAALVEF